MNYLITGGCGFIGVNLVKHLLQKGHKISVVDNLCVGKKEYLEQVCDINKDIDLFIGNIDDSSLITDVCKDIDVVVHLAARSGVRESVEFPRVWFNDNVVGTFNVFESARLNGVKKIITASSSAAVGNIDPPINEEVPVHPVSPYGASKTTMEAYASAYSHSYDIDIVTLRFSNVYGPMSWHKISIISKFIRKIIGNECLNIYGDGKQTRDFIFVSDLVRAIEICSLKDDIGGETFQISTGIEHSVNKVVNMIIKYFPDNDISVKHVDPMIGDIKTNWADNSKAKKILGWNPNVNLKSGISDTIEWFKENFYKET